MKPRHLIIGEVMQLDPAYQPDVFGGAFFVVTEPKPWGAQVRACLSCLPCSTVPNAKEARAHPPREEENSTKSTQRCRRPAEHTALCPPDT